MYFPYYLFYLSLYIWAFFFGILNFHIYLGFFSVLVPSPALVLVLLCCLPLPSEDGKILERVDTRTVMRPLVPPMGVKRPLISPVEVRRPLAPLVRAVVRPLGLPHGIILVPAWLSLLLALDTTPVIPGFLDTDPRVEITTSAPL